MRVELNRHTFDDILRCWHRAVGGSEATVAQMAKPLGLSLAGRVRLGHQLRQEHGRVISGYMAMRSRNMCGSVRKWSVVKLTDGVVRDAAGETVG
jgi:hypothetical protein